MYLQNVVAKLGSEQPSMYALALAAQTAQTAPAAGESSEAAVPYAP